jgi:hypothetical protein
MPGISYIEEGKSISLAMCDSNFLNQEKKSQFQFET